MSDPIQTQSDTGESIDFLNLPPCTVSAEASPPASLPESQKTAQVEPELCSGVMELERIGASSPIPKLVTQNKFSSIAARPQQPPKTSILPDWMRPIKRPLASTVDAIPVKRVAQYSTTTAVTFSDATDSDALWLLMQEGETKALNEAIGLTRCNVNGSGVKVMLNKFDASDWKPCDESLQSMINESDTHWVTAQLFKKVCIGL